MPYQMVLQSRERPFSVRQRQPDRLSRAFGGVASARVDLVRALNHEAEFLHD
jgi:hypothetical protein